ncbi:MAG: extracellular solute-binding protein [Candidatus Thiodiazotropha sp. (ex Semelilucina semeliformis)]|nr:extracellular solute-binding protein [Candidatus Thiodiazotropha sp. (ex Semelilucina semeliformis)]
MPVQTTLCLATLLLFISGCTDSNGIQGGVTSLEVWAHAGQESERNTLKSQINRYNTEHPDSSVHLTLIPEGSYNAQVQAAAVAGDLPDLLEFDGPFLYAYVWQGRLQPLDELLSKALISDLLPSILQQGSYQDRLWSIGAFDSGLGLYANRSRLVHTGIRIPTLDNPWAVDEFNTILERLVRDDPDGQVLDLKLNYAGEWYTYAFSPLIQSAGGDLVSRRKKVAAKGMLNRSETAAALHTLQHWIEAGWVDPNIDDAAFTTGRVALAMGGHWNYSRYRESLGKDLLLLPLPDFGQGPKTGQGSWSWAITSNCDKPEEAARFLSFLLRPEEVLAMTDANGAVPATISAIDRSPRYQAGAPLRLFVDQLKGGYAVPRPRTPAYPVITAEFQQAFERIRSGSDVQAVLDEAAGVIDLEIEDNRGYPWLFTTEER